LSANICWKLTREKGQVVCIQLKDFCKLLDEMLPCWAATIVFNIVEILRGNRGSVLALYVRGKLFLAESKLLSCFKNSAAKRPLRCDGILQSDATQVC
jgi:hypothetical protein